MHTMTTHRNAFPTNVEEMNSSDFYHDRDAHFSHQEECLKDKVRMMAYRNAILNNKHLFRGKTVLHIRCGMCLLSMFAARAGAARVIAVDRSNIVDYAQDIVRANNLDHVITLIKGKLEAIELPDKIKQVDIIICDWMGECLFSGAILNAVIYARNKWLNPKGGIILPDRCTMFVSAIEAREQVDLKIDYWDDVYGFDMSAIGKDAIQEPRVNEVNPAKIITDSCMIKEINMYTVVLQDCDFVAHFQLKAKRNDFVQALVTYFNVEFTKNKQRLAISTSPFSPVTQWKQTVFLLEEILTIKSGEQISGTFAMKRNGRHSKKLTIDIDVLFEGDLSSVVQRGHYQMLP